MDRAEMPGGTTDPVSERRAVEVDALPLVDLRLSIQRQVIGILGDQNLSDGCLRRNPAFNQSGGSRSLNDDILAGPAGILRTADDQHAELSGNDIELLADVLTDPVQITPTARAGMVIDIHDHLDAWQVGWQRTPVRSPFGNTRLAQSGGRLLLLFQTIRFDLFGFLQA